MPANAEHCRAYRRRLRLRLAVLFGIQCQTCGGNRNLQYAHVRPTGVSGAGRGLTRRLLDVLKHPDHYILECRRCHRHRDNKAAEGVPF